MNELIYKINVKLIIKNGELKSIRIYEMDFGEIELYVKNGNKLHRMKRNHSPVSSSAGSELQLISKDPNQIELNFGKKKGRHKKAMNGRSKR